MLLSTGSSPRKVLTSVLNWGVIFSNRAMISQENESLCARLAPEVYNKLNLVNCLYTEFFFKEMSHILHLQGMERWPMREPSQTNSSQLLFSLVIFSPLKDVPQQAASRSKITTARSLAQEMFFSSFEAKEDHDSIKAAMEIFPTVGIFMCVIANKKKQGKKK